MTCREFSRIHASEELARAGLWRSLTAKLHWLICQNCRAYIRQIRSVGSMARRHWHESPSGVREIQNLEARIVDELRRKG
jgi:hypothetical protein